MKIFFLRHGEAERKTEGMEDKDRPLTSLGAAAISNAGKSLKLKTGRLDLILTSPLLRAVQSADIIGNIFGIKDRIVKSENMLVGTPPYILLNEMKKRKRAKNILVVGHQPHLSECISFLTGTDENRISIGKGACVLVDMRSLKAKEGRLVWIKEYSSGDR